MPHLVLADADKVHDYVFGTQELKLIRGASELQRWLAEEHLRQLCNGEVIFAGGGRVLAEFLNADDAQAFRWRAERAFVQQAVTATVTTESAAYEPGEFAHGLEAVQERLERRKTEGRPGGRAAGNWFFVACEACDREPASEVVDDRGTERRLGTACLRRSLRNREVEQREGPRAADFETIARGSRPENYLAVAYCDMDRLGRWLASEVRTKEDYGRLSEAIDSGVRRAVRETLDEIAGNRADLGYEILLMGGDDAVVVMRPQLIFAFVEGFYQRLATIPNRPACSMGILIAHHHYPIAKFVEGAEQLLRNAKKERVGDAVDYAVLNESMTMTAVMGRKAGADKAFRTAKPYDITTNGFPGLAGKLMRLKEGVSSSRLKEIGRLVHRPREEALMEYAFLLLRSPEAERRVLLNEIGMDLWSLRNGKECTEVADLIELWRVV